MATQQTRHLWAAAHALAETSPSVSAHLMTRLFKLSSDREVNLSEATMACAACGTIIVPGLNSHVRTFNDYKLKRKASNPLNTPSAPMEPSSQALEEISKLRVVYECWTCGRSTTQQVPLPKCKSSNRVRSRLASKNPASSSLPAQQQLVADVSSSSSTTAAAAGARSSPTSSAPTPSQNAGSKKRARSRKENSLSAILAAKKKQDSSSGGRGNVGGFGLDLMDLMKTG
ncbi:hypothetical protein Q9L58_002656 [Maublancomyces gigas]|uniref:Uncharacterized protein n=1 Tax=Discina gigas TaxID=1032678 RepID=A0ABR3GRB6_9PEZI